MDLTNKTMNYLRQRSSELLGKIVVETAKIKAASVSIENLEYEHHELCIELLRRTDSPAVGSTSYDVPLEGHCGQP
jgi:hypothetical protein